LPLAGKFYDLPVMSKELAVIAMVRILGVTEAKEKEEVDINRGAYARFPWLRDFYIDHMDAVRFGCKDLYVPTCRMYFICRQEFNRMQSSVSRIV
jgi:hypothetical protein